MFKFTPKALSLLKTPELRSCLTSKTSKISNINASKLPNIGSFFVPQCYSRFSTNPQSPQEEPLKDSEVNIHSHASTNQHSAIRNMSYSYLNEYFKNEEITAEDNTKYHSKTIYALTEQLKKRPQIPKTNFADSGLWRTFYAFGFLIWAPMSYYTFTHFQPMWTLLPVSAFLIFAAMINRTQNVFQPTVLKMDLEGPEYVNLYLWGNQGAPTLVRIEGCELREVILGKKADQAKSQNPEDKENMTIIARFIDAKTNKKVTANFFVCNDESPIENLDLFKKILYGRTSEVEKFHFVPPPSESSDDKSDTNL